MFLPSVCPASLSFFLAHPTLHRPPFISQPLIGFANCKLTLLPCRWPPTLFRLRITSQRSHFSRTVSPWHKCYVVLDKAVINTSVRMDCVGVNMQRVLSYWREVVIEVQVWEIIHHEMVAVDNLHDRGIQNDVAWRGILYLRLPINHSQPSVTTQHPLPVSTHTHAHTVTKGAGKWK